jgi:hypothetical protein
MLYALVNLFIAEAVIGSPEKNYEKRSLLLRVKQVCQKTYFTFQGPETWMASRGTEPVKV